LGSSEIGLIDSTSPDRKFMAASNLFRAGVLSVGTTLSIWSCSSASKDAPVAARADGQPGPRAGAVETVTAPAIGTGNEGPPELDLAAGSPTTSSDTASCAGTVSQAEFVSVDLFIMLDISGSMLELTPAGTDKWTAVKSALSSFLEDPRSSGLGVGIQYFPLNKPGVPDRCASDAECGAGGPCLLDTCLGALTQLGAQLPCRTARDCMVGATLTDFGPCVAIGVCSADPNYLCQIPGLPCLLDTGPVGLCVPRTTGVCADRLVCDTPAYASPAVAIAPLPGAAPALLASIDTQVPDGGTPSGPALSGAIRQAQEWAGSHPGHAVTALLVTDGLPTDCTPLDSGGLSEIAAAGLSASASVRTFAIGVFAAGDLTGPANLDAIARSGGTQSAFVIDTGQDIAAQFLDALSAIRGTQLGCEFELPAASSSTPLDYGLVNVDLTDEAGQTRIYKVAGLPACGTENGWYYDDELHPRRIIACPASCDRFRSALRGASVEIQLGCKTVIR
jgi:hypothetical protein